METSSKSCLFFRTFFVKFDDRSYSDEVFGVSRVAGIGSGMFRSRLGTKFAPLTGLRQPPKMRTVHRHPLGSLWFAVVLNAACEHGATRLNAAAEGLVATSRRHRYLSKHVLGSFARKRKRRERMS